MALDASADEIRQYIGHDEKRKEIAFNEGKKRKVLVDEAQDLEV